MNTIAKIRYAVWLFILLIAATALSGQTSAELSWRNWSANSAYGMPVGRWQVGIFQALRYGYSESVELSLHPLAFFLMPNLDAKWCHGSISGLQVASRHSIYYPTPLLRTLSREGTGGIISPEFTIPHMISIYTELLVSSPLGRDHLLTGKAGLCLAIRSGPLDARSTIDLPLVFPRLAVFYQDYGFRGGMDVQGLILRRWHYLLDGDLFYYPKGEENFAFEHRGLVLWQKSPRFQFCVGYKLCYGQYPFGSQWHLLMPLLDLEWAWQK